MKTDRESVKWSRISMLRAAESERDAYKVDAERYWWLRDNFSYDEPGVWSLSFSTSITCFEDAVDAQSARGDGKA